MTIDRRALLVSGALLGASEAEASERHRLIACEEAFGLPEIQAATSAWLASHPGAEPVSRALRDGFGAEQAGRWFRDLFSLGPEREAAMAQAGIDTQLLLLSSPGVQILDAPQASELAALANDRMSALKQSSPRRYAPLATIAPQDPAAAVLELERAMTRLDLHGLVINSHTRGEYLDDPKFWPILEAAEALNAPLYLHPREPAPAMASPYLQYATMGPIWGFAADTGLHALRMILAGVFDRFPRLQVVLGHLGEGLPFFIDRIDIRYRVDGSPARTALRRLPSEYLKDNFHLTTSGMNWAPALKQALEVMGPDRIQFAADWPFEDATDAADRFRRIDLPGRVRRKISHQNAERLWRIDA